MGGTQGTGRMAKILLAADPTSARTRAPLRPCLEAAGHEVREVGDGPAVLAALRVALPDALVLDTALPVLDGFHVLAEIRRSPRLERLPVVMFSTLPRSLGNELARQLGVSFFLSRPFRAADIAAAVEHQLAILRGESVKPPAPRVHPDPDDADTVRALPIPRTTALPEADAEPDPPDDVAVGEVVELPPNRPRGEGADRRRYRA